MYTSDRVSAFDVVFDETVPQKGRLLKQISSAWCAALEQRSGLCQKHDFRCDLLHHNDVAGGLPPPYCDHADNDFFRARRLCAANRTH